MRKYNNILVHSLVNLGDVLLSTSAVALLKKLKPQAKITMMVRPVARGLVENNPVIDEVLIYDYKAKGKSIKGMLEMIKEIKSRKFDLCISFDRKLRPALLTMLAGIPVRVGPERVFDDVPSKITMLYTDVVKINHDIINTLQAETYQEIIRGFFGEKGTAKPVMANIMPVNNHKAENLLAVLPPAQYKIALCVKGTFPLKTWPKEYFAAVIDELNCKYDASFIIVGAPEDKEYADEVIALTNVPVYNACGQTNLVDLAALFNKIDLLVTVDTGATHIAATTGVNMVVMYGCTSPNRWHPLNPNARALTTQEQCCPCNISADECLKPKCLWEITPDVVLEKCDGLIELEVR